MDPAKLHPADQLLIDSSELIFVFLFSSFLPALRPTGTTAIKRLPHDSYGHHACGHIITTCMHTKYKALSGALGQICNSFY